MRLLRIPKKKKILIFVAHPDDELMLVSFIILLLQAQCEITLICLTGGEGKEQGPTAEDKRATRCFELKTSCEKLGIQHHEVWHEVDGRLRKKGKKILMERMAEKIKSIKPFIILTIDHTGVTHHKDHQAVCSLTLDATRLSGCKTKILGVTVPHELFGKIFPELLKRRKSKYHYQDKVTHPVLKQTLGVKLNLKGIEQVAKSHPSQKLENYLEIFKDCKFEYYIDLTPTGS